VTGGRAIADWMVRHGLDHFFNVPGETFLSALEAVDDEPRIRLVTNRHESGASFAAEAFAKVAGRPAVCMATRGPGAANLSIGIQTAQYDATPLLALVGLAPSSSDDSEPFQSFDPKALFGSFAKAVQVVRHRETLVAHLEQAHATAVRGRPGSVVVGISADVLGATGPPEQPDRSVADPISGSCDVEAVMALVEGARRPCVIAATEAVRGTTAEQLARFVGALGLPVFGAWRRYSAFDNAHPCFVGPLGLGGSSEVADAVRSADVVLCLGFAVEEITARAAGFDRPEVTVVQVARASDGARARHVGRGKLIELAVEPSTAVHALSTWVERNPERAEELRDRHEPVTESLVARLRPRDPPAPREGPVDLAHFMQRLDAALPKTAIVTSDAGNFAQWLLRYVRFGQERAFLGPLNGAMGYGLPAAVGAGLAAPDRPVCCVAGDGGLLMTAGEMETADRLGLAVLAVVVNNRAYGTIRARQHELDPTRLPGTRLGDVDFAALARSMRWSAWRVERDTDVQPVLDEATAAGGCRLIEVLVEENPLALV
jgi:acetolactate synthase I/II/III large subunit